MAGTARGARTDPSQPARARSGDDIPMASSQVSSSSTPPAPVELVSHSDRETHRIGARLGAACEPGDLILLEGGLGAGKTALAQGIGQGLGISTTINSPTFTLVKEYRGRLPFYHFDLYRLADVNAVAELGIEDYLTGDGVCVVEWAERAAPLWPDDGLRIRVAVTGPHERRLRLEAIGLRGEALRRAVVRAAHLAAHAEEEASPCS
jgi:tRNA threonylcarbamoyladenosine biosynthesis protein TsaE